MVTDGALAASQAAQDPTVELKGKTFTTEYYGVAMKKGSDDLVRRVNQVLEDYRQSGWQDGVRQVALPDAGRGLPVVESARTEVQVAGTGSDWQ